MCIGGAADQSELGSGLASLSRARASPMARQPSPALVHSTSSPDVGVGVALADLRAPGVCRIDAQPGRPLVVERDDRMAAAAQVDVVAGRLDDDDLGFVGRRCGAALPASAA